MDRPAPGINALLGRVEVRVVTCEATFELRQGHPTISGAGRKPTRVEVSAPGCTIGRGSEADLQVVGPDARDVSRLHLFLQPSGRQWTVTDIGSRNHTSEVDPETGGWRRVGRDRPLPIEPKMLLNLGGRMFLRFDLKYDARAGATTTGPAEGEPLGAARVRPLRLENAAEALMARRRIDRRDGRPPSTAELLSLVDCERAELFRRLRELKELPEIAVYTPRDRAELCEALERAFPYLLAPRPGGP